MEYITDTLEMLSKWEKYAFMYEDALLYAFAKGGVELLGITFSSERVDFLFLSDCGMHYTDSAPIHRWLNFLEGNTDA